MALITVCIPVYNGFPYIMETINSVLNQTFTDFELLIFDNCSTDDTVENIKKIDDPRIRIYNNPTNIGAISNWKNALEQSNSKYVKLLPADDLLLEDCLESEVAIFENDVAKEISLVCSKRKIIFGESNFNLHIGFANQNLLINGIDAINRNIRKGGNTIGEPGSVLIRRSFYEELSFLNSNTNFWTIDLLIWYELLTKGKLYYINKTLACFRLSNVSYSVNSSNDDLLNIIEFNKACVKEPRYNIKKYNYYLSYINNFIKKHLKYLLIKLLVKP